MAIAGAAGCDDEDESGAGSELTSLVPPDVPAYAEAVVRPQGDQREELESALGTLLNADDPGAKIVDALNEGLAEEDLSYEEDIEPWLGERAAIFATSFESSTPEYAVVVESTDADAAVETLRSADAQEEEERTHDGVQYLVDEDGDAAGNIQDHLVAGSVGGVEAVIEAAAGESLADSGGLGSEFEEVADDLVAFYADPEAVMEALAATDEVPPAQLEAARAQLGALGQGPVVGGLDASADSFGLELSTAAGERETTTASDLFDDLPADSWLAIAAGNLGAVAEQAIDSFNVQLQATPFVPPELRGGIEEAIRREAGIDLREDILAWMGDVGVYARGTSIFGLAAGLVVETDDEDATLRALDRLRTALESEPVVEIAPLEIEGEGFELRFPGAPVQVPIVVRDGKLVAGLGDASVEEALDPDERLGESDASGILTEALGEDFEPTVLIDFEPVVELIESTGAASDDPDFAAAKPYLDALDFLAAGQRSDGGRTTLRIVLGVDEAEE
jgi:Protein of unknown function (DUF3352)